MAEVLGDGAYDSSRVYALLEGLGIEVTVKPKRNGRSDRVTRVGVGRWSWFGASGTMGG